MIVLYTLTMLLSVIGNVLAIAAFVVSRRHIAVDARVYRARISRRSLTFWS